jgi:hypothetical protein
MITHNKRSNRQGNIYIQVATIAITILTVFGYIFLTAEPQVTMKVTSFIQVLTLIIFSVTGTVTVRQFKHQSDDRARAVGIQYATLSQGKVADIDRLFMSNPNLDRLYFEMYSHDPHIKKIVKMRGPIKETLEMLKAEHQSSNLIFQKMADIYACEKLENPTEDCIEWINTFRAWMQSPILRSHWQYFKYQQHPEFREFVQRRLIARNKFISLRGRQQAQQGQQGQQRSELVQTLTWG